MADPRTFTLIGEFKDGITPELEKINKQLAALKANFAGVGSKKNTGFRGATKEIGKLVSAHKNLADSIKNVGTELRSTSSILRQYSREMGRAAAATRSFQKSGGTLGSSAFAKEMRKANSEAQAYLKTLQQINRSAPRSLRPPTGGGGGGRRGGGGGGGRRGGGGEDFHMGQFGFAFTLGSAISQPITNSIVQGFQIGTDMMMKPFQYFAGAFGERVQDQISDLKAAGGFLSISRRSKNPFLKDIDEAIQYQQDTNQTFAKMAAALPGVTNDYVQVGKRLGDTAARIVGADFKGAVAEANRIRATEEGRKFYGEQITGTGAKSQRDTITTLLGELTKKTTLAGMGGRSGAGGISGAYGLPGLTERMLSQDEVSMGQFQRYAAVFSDPTISDALARNIDEINKTQKNSVDRYKALNKLLDEVVTPDLIAKLRTSVDGIYQGLKSAIFDPDTGLFGLGRQFNGVAKKINDLGQYVDEFGNAVSDVSKAVNDDLSVFEMVSQIFAQVGQVVTPIIENIGYVFDPLRKIASLLVKARHYTAEFARTFNNYVQGLEDLSKQKGFEYIQKDGFMRLRASLGAVNNLLLNVGAISEGQFAANAKTLKADFGKDPGKVIGNIMKTMIDQLLNSKAAEEIGLFIGQIVGSVLVEVAKVTGVISKRIESSNKLFEGLKAGFDGAGGARAIGLIFKDIFSSMFKVLTGIMSVLPMEAYIAMAIGLVAPAIIQGASLALAQKIGGIVTAAFAGGGGAAGGAAGLAAIPIWGQIAALAAALVLLEKPIMTITTSLQNAGRKLQESGNWLTSAFGQVTQGLGQFIAGITQFFNGIWEIVSGLLSGDADRVVAGIKKLLQGVANLFVGIGRTVGGLGGVVIGAIGNLLNTVAELFRRAKNYVLDKLGLGFLTNDTPVGQRPNVTPNVPGAPKPPPPGAGKGRWVTVDRGGRQQWVADAFGSPGSKFSSFGAAVNSEMRNKPPGSNLVIANSSETVIPAAGGYGMKEFMGILEGGFMMVSNQYKSLATGVNDVASSQQKTQNQLSSLIQTVNSLASSVSSMGSMGGMGGFGGGMGLGSGMGGAGVQVAGMLGNFIKQTGGAPGSIHEHPMHGGVKGRHSPGSYHYSGRAIDIGAYANEQAGVIARIQAFNAKHGVRPVEFLHAGNDRNHQDHVHVAYALGQGRPAFFNSQGAAERWEASMAGRMNVRSITGNTAEGFGSSVGNIYVTVNAGSTTDPDALAYVVAERIQRAVSDAVNANILV